MKQKKWFLLLYLLMGISMTICAQDMPENTDSIPPVEATMLFDRESYHLGLIQDNTKPTTYSFFYCNVGQKGLIIKRIEATCGCTITQYPTDSLFYDESGQIDIAIAPCKEAGKFKKGIYVYTNAGTFRLTLSGEFASADYRYEDYSAIPPKDASTDSATESGDSVSIEDASTSSATGRDDSATDNASDVTKSKEKKKKKKKKKERKNINQITD